MSISLLGTPATYCEGVRGVAIYSGSVVCTYIEHQDTFCVTVQNSTRKIELPLLSGRGHPCSSGLL